MKTEIFFNGDISTGHILMGHHCKLRINEQKAFMVQIRIRVFIFLWLNEARKAV